MARRISVDSIKKMTSGYEAPKVCVCPVDGVVSENPSGLPCEVRGCVSDGKTRLVVKSFE